MSPRQATGAPAPAPGSRRARAQRRWPAAPAAATAGRGRAGQVRYARLRRWRQPIRSSLDHLIGAWRSHRATKRIILRTLSHTLRMLLARIIRERSTGSGGRVTRRGWGRVSAHGRTSLRRCGEEFPIGWAAASHCCAGNGAPDPSPLPAASPGRATVWAFTNIPRRPRAGAWSVASIASRLMRGCERLGRRHGGMGVALLRPLIQATETGASDVRRDRSRPRPTIRPGHPVRSPWTLAPAGRRA